MLPPLLTAYHAVAFSTGPPSHRWLPIKPIDQNTGRFSLVFVVDRPAGKVLLGLKKRGFGAGLWNGFGGKPEAHEDMHECALRELREECGLVAGSLHPAGSLLITRADPISEGDSTVELSLFVCFESSGAADESDEMVPQWFSFPSGEGSIQACQYDDIPWGQMWPEASLYLPALLSSVIRNAEPEGLVGRVDYCWTPLCTGEEISRHDRAQIPDNIQIGRTGREDSELLKEEMCAWWLGFTCRL